MNLLANCTLCPRNCQVDRTNAQTGFCGQTSEIRAARAALHMWEEPCISGTAGSGGVFFSGCNLGCIFCQNYNIALGETGKTISVQRLADIFLELQELGAANINLVTPTPFVPQIAKALILSKNQGLTLPVVYNTGSYEYVNTLKILDGLIDVYLPDLKYVSAELSMRFSKAADYFEIASSAIAEMFRQTGPVVMDTYIKKGVIVRHLALPNHIKDSKQVLDYLYRTYHNDIYVSILSQYTPLPQVSSIADLNRKLTKGEYNRLVNYALEIGIENAFIQEGSVAKESFIPEFDCTGI